MSESVNLNTMLTSWASRPSIGSYPAISFDGNVVSGPFIESAWVDGKDMLAVEYVLEGREQDCRLQPLIYYAADGSLTMTPSSTPKYSQSEADRTECVVAVYQ